MTTPSSKDENTTDEVIPKAEKLEKSEQESQPGPVTGEQAQKPKIPLIIGLSIFLGFLFGLGLAKFIGIFGSTGFWKDFLTGPPMAGIFALAAAGVAFLAAKIGSDAAKEGTRQSTQTAVRNARRQEWWNKAEWALNLATSDDSSNRAVGIEALRLMLTDAEEQEAAMLARVIGDVSGGAYKPAVEDSTETDANPDEKKDNGAEGGGDK